MPVLKTGSKFKSSIGVFIFSLLVSLIPLGIVFALSFHDKDVWTFPYAYYVYACIGAMLYFALYNGLIASRRRRRYIVYRYVTYILLIATIVAGFIFREQTSYVSFNIAAMMLFTYSVYQFIDNSKDKSDVLIRYLVPVVIVVIGLIPNLWFLSVGWVNAINIFGFIVFVPFAVTTLIVTINYHRKKLLENAVSDEYDYKEYTEEDFKEQWDREDASKAGMELSGGPDAQWKMRPFTVNYLKESADRFYQEAERKLNDRIRDKERDYKQAKFDYEHLSYDDAEQTYKKSLAIYNYYVDCYNNLDKEYKQIMHDIEVFSKIIITSKNYGQYIIFDFIKRYDRKKKYHNKNACKVNIRTFQRTYCARNDYPGVTVQFAEYISSYLDFDQIK